MTNHRPEDASAAPTITERLAKWICDGRDSGPGLTDSTVQATTRLVLDWLGSALAGCRTPAGRALLAYASREPYATASIIGWPEMRSAEVAAMTNGGLSHIVEMDDVERRSVLHPAAVVIPAALAVAEETQATGHELLRAILQGYEVAIRIGAAVGDEHYYYFHNTSTCGIFGAAAAAGSLLGLDAHRLTSTLGSAGTQAFGLWQFNEDATMSKHLHAGRAAASGVLSAKLGAHGFTGARAILEGRRGLFRAMAPGASPDRVLIGLERATDSPKLLEVSLKPYPSCRHTHASIDAAYHLRREAKGRGVRQVDIFTYQAALDLCDRPAPASSAEAKFSLQYCLAAAWEADELGLDEFSEAATRSSTRREMMRRVSVYAASDIQSTYPEAFSARVRIRLEDGTELERTITHPKGDPENPMSASEVESKFRRICGLNDVEAESAIQWAQSLGQRDSVVPPTLSAGIPAGSA